MSNDLSTNNTITTTNTREHYAGLIRGDLQKSVEGIIAAGHHLIAAKNALDHGEFTNMVATDLPFGKRTAQRLMRIAEHPVLSKATPASLLPQSWTTLYELTKLPTTTSRCSGRPSHKARTRNGVRPR